MSDRLLTTAVHLLWSNKLACKLPCIWEISLNPQTAEDLEERAVKVHQCNPSLDIVGDPHSLDCQSIDAKPGRLLHGRAAEGQWHASASAPASKGPSSPRSLPACPTPPVPFQCIPASSLRLHSTSGGKTGFHVQNSVPSEKSVVS